MLNSTRTAVVDGPSLREGPLPWWYSCRPRVFLITAVPLRRQLLPGAIRHHIRMARACCPGCTHGKASLFVSSASHGTSHVDQSRLSAGAAFLFDALRIGFNQDIHRDRLKAEGRRTVGLCLSRTSLMKEHHRNRQRGRNRSRSRKADSVTVTDSRTGWRDRTLLGIDMRWRS